MESGWAAFSHGLKQWPFKVIFAPKFIYYRELPQVPSYLKEKGFFPISFLIRQWFMTLIEIFQFACNNFKNSLTY